jgi:uncharacterized protein YndB with AHSA1/START domain
MADSRAESRFVYVTYIRAPAETVWEHLTSPALNRLFWGGYHQHSNWQVGDDYQVLGPDGRAWDAGKVLAADRPRRLSVSWLHLNDAALKAEGHSTATFDLEPGGEGVTKLTLTHTMGVADSRLIAAVSVGWPSILSSLKSLLETGRALG